MAGIIAVDTIQNGSGASVPTTTVINGSAKAWVNFNGTTASIRASYNVSSITRNGAGDYTVNFSTAMPDANYCVSNYSVSASNNWYWGRVVSYATTGYRFITVDNLGTLTDTAYGNIACFR